MTTIPKPRWPRFTLRTLFVVVTVVGLAVGWFVYQLNWIRQRDEFLTKNRTRALEFGYVGSFLCGGPPHIANYAPGLLWVFGENPINQVDLLFPTDRGWREPKPVEQTEIELAQRLFPEAMVVPIFTKPLTE